MIMITQNVNKNFLLLKNIFLKMVKKKNFFIIRYFPVREIAIQTSGFHHHRQKLKMRNISGITGIPGFISRFHWPIQKSGSICSCYLYKNDILRNRKYE